jgi:arginase family enzyme
MLPQKPKNKLNIDLIGAPDDRGVMNVGGRIGAAFGPKFIKEKFLQMGEGIDGALKNLIIHHEKNAQYLETIEKSHESLKEMVTESLKKNFFPVVLGGGHDYGYPHVAAVTEVFGVENVALINIDAHLDLRRVIDNKITSGSPFFLALENKAILGKNFIEFGIQPHCNSEELKNYALEKGVKIIPFKEASVLLFKDFLENFTKQGKKIVVSFDLDSVSMAWSMGVSAPQAEGFSASQILEMSELVGSCSNVVSIGYFEVAPDLDFLGKTVLLTATALHRFCSKRAFL